ncbi:hypothetical protein [Devosia ginsengisoli]|uniref:Uncharacterized protein n=1 Tax=Devosia ginsengisoli TaxID=400770 RepID=A0A5B8LS37_9HYPH|nr:hypothetical protein [Devosia ginsengisoli]QDZ10555.1 hypothetical protein FPZ08_07195 [Devosia ginsengisoli]
MARTVKGWRQQYIWDRPRIKRSAPAPLTAEQVEENGRKSDELIARFFETHGVNTGLEKIKDREARTAVEGDTDLNHDNVEAAE